MNKRKSILIAVIIIVTATLLIIPTNAVTYAITDLTGYTITFNNELSYPLDNQEYYVWNIDFTTKETNVATNQFNQLQLRKNPNNNNAIELIYSKYINGSIFTNYVAYSSDTGWASSPSKAITIIGGVSKDSPSLLSFVNYNSNTATVSYEYIEDPYTYIFGEISGSQSNIANLNFTWESWTQGMSIAQAFGTLARPYVPYLDTIGYPTVMMGVAVSIVLFLKRMTHNSSNHEKKETK